MDQRAQSCFSFFALKLTEPFNYQSSFIPREIHSVRDRSDTAHKMQAFAALPQAKNQEDVAVHKAAADGASKEPPASQPQMGESHPPAVSVQAYSHPS